MDPVQVVIDYREVEADEATAVQSAVASALVRLPVPAAAHLALVLTDDAVLRELNHSHRGRDEPTDVLSFPAQDEDQEPGAPPYLGDVIIAVPQAEANAHAAGHSRKQELCLLAVHGLLHLLGHEDETLLGAAAMYRLEIDLGVRQADDVPEEIRPLL